MEKLPQQNQENESHNFGQLRMDTAIKIHQLFNQINFVKSSSELGKFEKACSEINEKIRRLIQIISAMNLDKSVKEYFLNSLENAIKGNETVLGWFDQQNTNENINLSPDAFNAKLNQIKNSFNCVFAEILRAN